MSSITTDLAGLLDTVQRPGDFYAAGSAEIFTPSLEVEGVGPIALPLLPVQAEQLIAVAEQAPYGRGEETVIDTNVRRTWQIDAAKFGLVVGTGRATWKPSSRGLPLAWGWPSPWWPNFTNCWYTTRAASS
jgi:hypothetical protein